MKDRQTPASLDDILALAAGRADAETRRRVLAEEAAHPEVRAEIDQWRAIAGAVTALAGDRAVPLPAAEALLTAARAAPAGAAASGATALNGALVTTLLAALSLLTGVMAWHGGWPPVRQQADDRSQVALSTGSAPVERMPTAIARRSRARSVSESSMDKDANDGASAGSRGGVPVSSASDVLRAPSAAGGPADRSGTLPGGSAGAGSEPGGSSSRVGDGERSAVGPGAGSSATPERSPGQPEPTQPPEPQPSPRPTQATEPTQTAEPSPTPSEGLVAFAVDDPAGEVLAFAWPLDGGDVRTLAVAEGSTHRLPVGRWLLVAQPGDGVPVWLGDGASASSPLDLAPITIAPGAVVSATWRFGGLPEDRAALHGQVEGADGGPASRAIVHARGADGQVWSVVVLPGDDGRFDIDVPTGEWSFAAASEPTGQPRWGEVLALAAGRRDEPIMLRLP